MQTVQTKFLDKNIESQLDIYLKIGMYSGEANPAVSRLIKEAEDLGIQIFTRLYANVPGGDAFEISGP